MFTVLTPISLNFILGRQSDQLSCSNSQDRLSCKNFPSCISQAFLLYYPLKPAVKMTINVPICNLCGALRDNKVKIGYCDVRSVNIRWDKVIDCVFLTICENKKIKGQNFEKNSKMVNKS